MSAAEFQKRIADLVFSAQEHMKALQKEQNDSEEDHQAWKDEGDSIAETGDERDDHEADEPTMIGHSTKIASIETAIGHLEAAVDELDGAIDED